MASLDAPLVGGSKAPILKLGLVGRLACSSSNRVRRLHHRRSHCHRHHGGAGVYAVAAPEKPSPGNAPFTAWDTATQRVAKRTDLKTIMILGAGPIIIGQVRCVCEV